MHRLGDHSRNPYNTEHLYCGRCVSITVYPPFSSAEQRSMADSVVGTVAWILKQQRAGKIVQARARYWYGDFAPVVHVDGCLRWADGWAIAHVNLLQAVLQHTEFRIAPEQGGTR